MADEPTFIGAVDIVTHDTSAPPAFAESLRGLVLTEGAAYGTTGRPISVKIDLERVHFKNALRALTIGDDNQAKGHVAVFDAATGRQLANFPVQVDADTAGLSMSAIALTVVGAFDPTGAVDIASTVGDAASADINRSGTAAAMRANFAAETLRQTFGDARTRAVMLARKNPAAAQAASAAPAP
jgi:hypothetical protein